MPIDNTATLSAIDQNDVNGSNDSATASLTPAAGVNLAMGITVDDDTPVRHQLLEFELSLTNEGSLDASGVVVDVTIPVGLTLESATVPVGVFDANGTWSVGPVTAGQTVLLGLIASVDTLPGGEVLTTTGLVASVDQSDPDPSNDVATVEVTIATESVDIVRDAFGTPHVFAASDQGAFFGAGYASAELRLSQMLRSRLIFRGQMAQYFGRGPGDAYLISDRQFRSMGMDRHIKRSILALDADTRSLLRAYADGVNAWMTRRAGDGAPGTRRVRRAARAVACVG